MTDNRFHESRNERRIPADRSVLDWIFVLRPVLHPPVWTIVIMGYFLSPTQESSAFRLVALLFISSGLAGWAYIINQITDIESDRLNRKLFYLPSGLISIKSAIIYACLLGVLSVIGAFIVGRGLGLIALALLIMGYLYSGRPFYAKNRPFYSTFLNGLGHGSLGLIFGFIGAGGLFRDSLLPSVPYMFAVMSVFIGTTLPDIEGDAVAGKRTPGIVLGIGSSVALMTLFLLLTLAFSLIFRDIPLSVVSVICVPFYLYALFNREMRSAVFAARLSALLLSLAACFLFPWYAPALLFLFVTSRLYYRKRFGINYPSLFI